MELSDVISDRICELLKENNMNVYQLSQKSGIPRSTLSKFLARKTETLRLENLLYICEAFNITLSQFFDDTRFDVAEANKWQKEK